MNVLALIDAGFTSLLAIYFLLGLFSAAPWLHTDGRRQDGQWVVVRMSRHVRLFLFLVVSYWDIRSFAEAFHKDFSAYYLPIDAVIGIGFLCLIWTEHKRKQKVPSP